MSAAVMPFAGDEDVDEDEDVSLVSLDWSRRRKNRAISSLSSSWWSVIQLSPLLNKSSK